MKRLSYLAVAAVLVAASAALVGCAGAAKGPTDEELIRMTVDKVKTALETKNLDMLLETFAEDFEHPEVGGKDEARDMLQMGMDAGYADDGEVSIESMEITIDAANNTATVYPVDLSGPPGSISVELILGKREVEVDGKAKPAWLITTINADGV